jgi:hypothetical protein
LLELTRADYIYNILLCTSIYLYRKATHIDFEKSSLSLRVSFERVKAGVRWQQVRGAASFFLDFFVSFCIKTKRKVISLKPINT